MGFENALSGLRVTLSIGIAEFVPGETVDHLLHRADQAMYQAKNQGRNQMGGGRSAMMPPGDRCCCASRRPVASLPQQISPTLVRSRRTREDMRLAF